MRELEQDVRADSGLCFQLAGAPCTYRRHDFICLVFVYLC